MSKGVKFINESLGACGFAVLRGQVAYIQRPDLWATASDCGHDLSAKQLENRLSSVYGCTTYLARFEGIDGPLIKVLARSGDQLAQRIEWITGFKVRQLIPESEMAGQRDESNIPARKTFPKGNTEGGDLHAGLVTAEPGRTCHQCEWSTSGRGCQKSEESQIRLPSLNEPRRCIAFRPRFENIDGRTGAQLWPELVTLKTIPQ